MESYLSDDAVLEVLGARLRDIRLAKNISQETLAENAGISKRTLIRIEAGNSIQLSVFIRILRALDLLDNIDALIPEPGVSPVTALRMQGKEKKRASKPRKESEGKQWQWGDDQ